MICVYTPDCTDFSGNGIGPVSPLSCTVTETLNGEWELTLTHPLDDAGKWRRLVEGCILRAPVPAAMTPGITIITQATPELKREVWKVRTNGSRLMLRSGTGTKYKIIGKYKNGAEVVLLEKTTSSWYKMLTSDGKQGYMSASWLQYVRTEITPGQGEAVNEVVEARQLRDQPFRIYRVVPELDKITVYARHVFYDLMDNMIRKYEPSATTTGANVAQGIASGCLSEHDFTFYSDLDTTAEEVAFENSNPVDAILGDGGLVEKYGGELARDWFDVFLVKRVGSDTNVQIRQGKNLLGISYDVDLTDVVTRIMPTGEDKDGNLLYLPEVYIDSPNIGNYPHPKWMHLAVSEAKEVTESDEKKSKDQCYTEMRNAVQAEYDKGCDLPTVTLKVDFINCAETEEYRDYKSLQNIFLGDSVRVVAPRIGVEVSMRMTQYTYDCLQRRYTAMTLGTVADTLEGNTISARQLPSGIITGPKLAINSVGIGALQNGSVGSLQIQMAAIQTAHIETAAITSALIAEAAIQTAHIGDAQITAAQIADATITAAQIARATITAACIADATITEAQIADASITAAKIALATITEANIAEAAIGTAQIADLAVTAAKIANATITSAKIAEAAIQTAHIQDAAITKAKIALLAVDEAQIADLAVGTAKIKDASVSTAKIQDLAVTAAKIANATITNAQIANATIGTAQIALGAITTALIQQGAVGTAQIADASITDAKIVELSANRITTGTLSVERLIIVGNEQSIVYTINEANGTPQLSQNTIDGGSLTQRSITADRIVAGAITANEIAAATILANNLAAGAVTAEKLAAESVDASKIKAGVITTNHVASNFGETLDLSSNTSIRSTISTTVGEALADIEIGGRNLLRNTRSNGLKPDDVLVRNTTHITASADEQGFGVMRCAGRGMAYMGFYAYIASSIAWEAGEKTASGELSGKTLAFSFDTRSDLEDVAPYTIPVSVMGLDSVSGNPRVLFKTVIGTSAAKAFYPAGSAGKWRRVRCIFTMPSDTEEWSTDSAFDAAPESICLTIGFTLASALTEGHWVDIRRMKLEVGDVSTDWTPAPEDTDAALSGMEIGGVNLIQNSSAYTLTADSAGSYWIAADELEPGTTYTFSVREVVLSAGQAPGVTWEVINRTTGAVHTSGLLDFTYGKQSVTFTIPNTEGNWALYLYAGVSGATTGVTVVFSKVKLEEGSVATSWSAAPEETSSAIGQIAGALEGLDEGLDGRVQAIIDALGLSEQFASTEAFLAALEDIELIRSELAQTDSDLTLTFNRLTAAESGLAQMFSYFQFGTNDGAPYLDMGSSSSSVKMRLTNTRLSFVQAGAELAYFSDNKLYVTRLEAVEQISIGTSTNGFLDMVTTPTGVGFKWRA